MEEEEKVEEEEKKVEEEEEKVEEDVIILEGEDGKMVRGQLLLQREINSNFIIRPGQACQTVGGIGERLLGALYRRNKFSEER